MFTPTSGPVPLNNLSAWRRWVRGANWRHPEATVGLISAAGPLQAQDKKPNIVMLMTDDTGWNDFGCYSGLGHPTPNVDQMAKEGRGLLEHFFERDWGD